LRPISTLFLSAFAISIASLEVGAQDVKSLPERLDTLTVRYGQSVIGRGVMLWTRHQGAQLQVYEWTSASDGSSVTDSLFADPVSLRPTREVRVTGDTTIVVDFRTEALTVRTFVAGKQAAAPSVVSGVNIYSSASIESLAASMPLVAGAEAHYETYYAPPARLGVRRTRIRVESAEQVAGRSAWRVHADTPGGGTWFWVDAETRTVLQSDTREGDAVITFRR
jgi:hypothetical protein